MLSAFSRHGRDLVAALFGVVCVALTSTAGESGPDQAKAPEIAPASPEAGRAAKAIKVPPGIRVDVFAAEPMIANPVAFGFDERGRAYVVETFRLHHGVTDTRQHMNWLDDDLACRTVEDRVAMYRKYLGAEFAEYGKDQDRIRLLEDRDGDGKADVATVFADGFHHHEDGLAAGVLARNGDVWFTCIPDLWKFRDVNGDGKADVRQSLQRGYGVHVGFLGHDLHGLKFGPDGRLYFSIGDRGLNVQTEGRVVQNLESGSVLRCNPDGSGLEIFATGLRNPQELAFDRFGNLFTCDNNSDSGDKARWVHVVEGGDSGWRIGYQFLTAPVSRGPWNAERLWEPLWNEQAAYLLPPLANLADGPSGLTVEPGTSLLPERYRHQFFLCDFRGSIGQSGVRTVGLKPRGASFEVVENEPFAWGLEATDVDFGPDGALYISDWVEGWRQTGKGRLFRVFDESKAKDPEAKGVQQQLATGTAKASHEMLAKLLAHADMRVRQDAQFRLAEQGPAAIEVLGRVAGSKDSQIARVHAIWGLEQVSRGARSALEPLRPLIDDSDAEIRAQAVKALGEAKDEPSAPRVVALLKDASPRVRFFAAMALGKVGGADRVGPLLALLREDGGRDPYLRHAAVMALVATGDVPAMLAKANDSSNAARLGILLALRRLGRPEVARFLDDSDPRLVLEAARAIYDTPIAAAMPALAGLAGRSGLAEPVLRRVENANSQVGQAANARATAELAARAGVPDAVRVEAIQILGEWSKPEGRDRVTGLWRPIAPRGADAASEAIQGVFAQLLAEKSSAVRSAVLATLGPLQPPGVGSKVYELFAAQGTSPENRVQAIQALERLGDNRLADAVEVAVRSTDAKLRVEGQRLLVKLRPEHAIGVLETVLDKGTTAERQGAFKALGALPGPDADRVLSRWLDRLQEHKTPAVITLDLLEAGRQRKSPEIAAKLKAFDAARSATDPIAGFRETLEGGDARRGERIVKEKAEVSCVRCHKVRGKGGEVGPELSGIGKRQSREYLLEAIVAPNRQIAEGFETLILALQDGQVVSGILKKDDGTRLHLVTADGKPLTVLKADIEDRKRGSSAMPDDVAKHLSKAEIRDLVEYLAGLK